MKTIGFCGLLNLALIILKLCGVIQLSWLILIPIMIVISVIPFIIFAIIVSYFDL